ncbi:uncharacterized protein SRS1_16326 [Sporisorium reilianum f. sp. reilianum]|uniref:Uncharacterized protein n=1 Tax=Sporisorium reilianum f. sp. reilianum TaxID=72559 RepID=A0A2N8ULI6_9BASI|nr:uncharacterized protein SRS1_16326 [Sporisorium reilianum f. sp. reilianum]
MPCPRQAAMIATSSSSTSSPPPRRSSRPESLRSTALHTDTACEPAFNAPLRSFSDPLTVTPRVGPHAQYSMGAAKAIAAEGRVPYGPGFYIPPPGYQRSSLGVQYEQRLGSGGERSAAPTETGTGYDPSTKLPRQDAGRADREKKRRPRSKVLAAERPSLRGSLIIWTVLSILLATSQLALLARYDSKKGGAASIGLVWAAISLELYAALVSTTGLLMVMVIPDGGKQKRSKGITSSLLDTLPTVCAIAVCLGASLQLASLLAYALQSPDNSITYSVLTAFITSLVITLGSIGRKLCVNRQPRRTSRKPISNRPNPPHLAVTDPGAAPSRPSSCASWHSGKYVPDYGLDSDSESDDDAPGARRPHADWMDRVLDRVVRSPLLDLPGSQR